MSSVTTLSKHPATEPQHKREFSNPFRCRPANSKRYMKREKHGMTKTSEFYSWNHMKDRCGNPNNQNYASYGGRGIKVCERWLVSFSAFIEDMGRKPSIYHTIDRINNDGNYEPTNCRWALMSEQNSNKSNARIITFNNKSQSITEWAKQLRVSVKTLRSRLNYGWSVERTLTTT